MKQKKLKKMLSLMLAALMIASVALTGTAAAPLLGNGYGYTDFNYRGAGGTNGWNYSTATFNPTDGTTYEDETFANLATTPIEGTFPATFPQDMLYGRSDEDVQALIDAIIPVLTFDEKIQMITAAGSDDAEKRNGVGYIDGVPRLGIPETRMNDGPAGINSLAPLGREATNPPVQLLSAMTWNPELEYEYGASLAKEHVSNGIGWQLGTQLDIGRTPFFARIKDTFGEDHVLAAAMGVAEVKGLQETGGAMSMSKHIGAYSSDGDTSLWVEVDEQTLHTSYLYPFEAVAKEAQLASIMGTYNRMNGLYTSSNPYLQIGILRNMWNWKGAMVPDWGADPEGNSLLSFLNGTTLHQNGAAQNGPKIRAAIKQGLLTMEDVNYFVSTVLYAYGVAGFLNLVQVDPNTGLAMEEVGRTSPVVYAVTYKEDWMDGLYEESNDIVLKMAEQGIVLAKNENNTLPLKESDYTADKSVAMIGYGAVSPITGTGGERSPGVGMYMSSPYESVLEIVGEDANIDAFVTNDKHGQVIPAEQVFQTAEGDETGWVDDQGAVLQQPTLRPENRGDIVNGENGNAIPAGSTRTLTGYFEAAQSGEHRFVVWFTKGSTPTFKVDDVAQTRTSDASSDHDWQTADGSQYRTYAVTMEAGQRYKLEVTGVNPFNWRVTSLNLQYLLPNYVANDLAAAKAAAADHDTVIMFTRTGATGHGPVPRTDYDISLGEKATIKEISDIAKANGNKFVLVVYSRSSFTFEGDWLDNVDSLLLPFYPGQSGSKAIAEILTGEVNPSGKLSVTFPKASNETLLTQGLTDVSQAWYEPTALLLERAGQMASVNDRGQLQNNSSFTAHYTEGLSHGYRWFEDEGVEPQYSFGHGLSYTTFAYSDYKFTPSADGTSVDVSVTVKNTGDVTGSEIVQVYVGPAQNVPDHIQTSAKQLAAFQRIDDIAPGESKTVTMTVDERALSYWDPKIDLIEHADGTKDKWVLAEGDREIFVGSSLDDIRHAETVEIGVVTPTIKALSESAFVGENFQFEVTADRSYNALKLVGETGKAVSIAALSVTNGDNANTWLLTTNVGTAGNRTFTVLAKRVGGDFEEIGTFDIAINKNTVAQSVRVNDAAFGASSITKNAPVSLTVKTTSNTATVKVLNENDGNMGKTLISKTAGSAGIEWIYEMSIGTAGSRAFTAAAAGSNGVYNYDYAKVATITVTK